MGACFSQDAADPDFKNKKNVIRDEFDGPIKSRGCTDVPALIIFFLFIAVWIGLVAYCMVHGDLDRIFKGYDDCGNICGIKNKPISGPQDVFRHCSGINLESKPYMLIHPRTDWEKTKKRECVSNCDVYPHYRKYFKRCIPKNESEALDLLTSKNLQELFENAAEDLSETWKEIVYLGLFALFLSMFLIFLFRYFTGFLVWFVLICVIVVCVAFTAYLWILWKDEKNKPGVVAEETTSTYFKNAIAATCFTIIILLLIFGMRKSIHLVSQLFYESGKAVQAMPFVVLQPFLAFFAVVTFLSVWVYFFLWIESSGFAKIKANSENNRLTFKKDEVIQFARIINCLAIFWVVQFIIGCQHMIIAGSVATWFFTRKKSALASPILKSYGYLFNFHLGTVAFGSLLIAILQIVRLFFTLVKKAISDPKNEVSQFLFKISSCCLYCLEKALVYLTRNAYIEVAIFGDKLWTSGQRAYHMLVNNALRVAAINSVGDFVLFLGKVLVVVCSVLIGYEILQKRETLHYSVVPLVVIGIVAYLISHAFMTAFEMIIDTIFICFCEDCEMNDGEENPYYMSKGLMEFVERSQKVLKVGDSTAQPKSQTARWVQED